MLIPVIHRQERLAAISSFYFFILLFFQRYVVVTVFVKNLLIKKHPTYAQDQ